jgi:hypothetical protein
MKEISLSTFLSKKKSYPFPFDTMLVCIMNICSIRTRILFGILFGSKLRRNIDFVWQEVIYYGGFGFD